MAPSHRPPRPRPRVQVAELRNRTAGLPDDYLVTLVGDMITEEGLPTYMTMLNTLDGVRDETGASSSPWAQWTRKWTAEENRHGALAHICVPSKQGDTAGPHLCPLVLRGHNQRCVPSRR